MPGLIDALTTAKNPRELNDALEEHASEVAARAGRGDRRLLFEAEEAAASGDAFRFAADGSARLVASGREWRCGTFEVASLAQLKAGVAPGSAPVRLWVLDGVSPLNDIGNLQATSGEGCLFQVASQFNCLEAPDPFIAKVGDYLKDPTQGPRAAVSAFPATLLRHYAAPGPDGSRFVQTTDGPQLDLLEGACGPGSGSNGYLMGDGALSPVEIVRRLEQNFEAIAVGVQRDAEVVYGANWLGGVPDPAPSIAQVFTSTVAGGYGGEQTFGTKFRAACTLLLRAAYLGTLRAALRSNERRVVLTLIGGGVFGNPIPLIWESIVWALDEVAGHAAHPLDVVVNGRNLGQEVSLESVVLPQVQRRGGALLAFANGAASLRR